MTTYYTKDHEWVRVEGSIAVTGITDHAQEALGDVVFVELPEIGKAVTQGGEMAVVESVKAASEVYAPISGTVTAANEALVADPALVNQSPEDAAWFCKIEVADPKELESLMSKAAYDAFVAEQG